MTFRYLPIIAVLLNISIFCTCCEKRGPVKDDRPTAVEQKKGTDQPGGGESGREEPALVSLSQGKQKASGIEVKEISFENAAVPLSATAAIEMNMDRAAKISPRVTGKAVSIISSQGDRVRAGQALAYIDSVELDQTWAEYLKTRGRVDLARRNLEREEILFEKKISPEKDVLRARQELRETEADLNFAIERFRIFGVNVSQLESSKGNGSHPFVAVTTPVGGVVVEKTVTQGEVVNPEKTLFSVADLSTLWVVIDIYEKDISRLRAGTGVKVSVTAFPEKTFRGKISYTGDVVDEKTRTEKARVTIDNSSGLLKPGMFATVLIEAAGRAERLISVPEEAVLIDGTKRYVFVQTASEKFQRRDIEVGRSIGDRLEIAAGLREKEKVVVKGAFILKSELKKDELKGD